MINQDEMRRYFSLLVAIFCLSPLVIFGQERLIANEGKVSYVTTSQVYIRFGSTDGIEKGDTLFLVENGKDKSSLTVSQKSSTSCVGKPQDATVWHVGDVVRQYKIRTAKSESKPDNEVNLPVPPAVIPSEVSDSSSQLLAKINQRSSTRKQLINGRLTFSTNGSVNPGDENNFQRIRTVFSMNIKNLASSPVSLESYVTYRHRYGIDQVNTGFYDDFKVFGLSANYDNGGRYTFTLGRKINPYMANMGAMDGVQAAARLGKYQLGAFAGTRPDFNDFSFNAGLPQFGAFIARTDTLGGQAAQTSIAFAEQMNDFRTDRRFLYVQHNNSVLRNMNIFLSSEVDLFKNVNGITDLRPSLTSLYASLRYRVRKNLSVSASYDNRRNVIYYESYQTYVDQLLAQETRQGLRFQVNYSPLKFVSLNASAFLRYQGSNPSPTKNWTGAVNLSNLAGKGSYMSLTINVLESYYFKGTISGFRLSENLFKGRLNAEVQYRHVNYAFFSSESDLKQHIGGINLSINLLKKTTLTCSYEGTFQQSGDWHRYFVTVIQRFKK